LSTELLKQIKDEVKHLSLYPKLAKAIFKDVDRENVPFDFQEIIELPSEEEKHTSHKEVDRLSKQLESIRVSNRKPVERIETPT